MTRSILLLGLPLLALSACNVSKDPGNGTTTISVDKDKVDAAADEAGNALQGAAGEVKDAANKAGPALGNAADDIGAGASRAGDKIENGADRAAGEIREETRDNPPRKQ